MPGRGSSG